MAITSLSRKEGGCFFSGTFSAGVFGEHLEQEGSWTGLQWGLLPSRVVPLLSDLGFLGRKSQFLNKPGRNGEAILHVRGAQFSTHLLEKALTPAIVRDGSRAGSAITPEQGGRLCWLCSSTGTQAKPPQSRGHKAAQLWLPTFPPGAQPRCRHGSISSL